MLALHSVLPYTMKKKGYDDRSSIVEQFAIHTFFTHWDTLGLCGGVLRVDGKLVGF